MSEQLYHLVLGQIAPGDREFTCQYSSTIWSWDRLHLVAGCTHVSKSSSTWSLDRLCQVVHMAVQLYHLVLGQTAPGDG